MLDNVFNDLCVRHLAKDVFEIVIGFEICLNDVVHAGDLIGLFGKPVHQKPLLDLLLGYPRI